ncbi:MAG: response regulator [Labilithrix sp.]
MHRLLERQLRRSKVAASPALGDLLALVDATYEEIDQERRRQERANALLSEEVRELNAAIRAEAEARVRAILDAVSDGVVMIDEAGRIDTLNAAASRLFGLAPGAVPIAPVHSLFEEGFAAPAASGEGAIMRVDGPSVPVEVTMSDALLGSRRLRIALVRDITERKTYEASLREATDRAKAASRAKSDFLATMSHELRTPMNGVLGMVGLLLDGELSPSQRACAEAVRESGESLLGLLNDVLDFSKIEAGKLTLEEYDFAPAGVVESVVELLAARALAKNIEVAVVVQPGVPQKALGDAGRLRQVLLNLVGNAVKFTEVGGVVVEMRATGGTGDGFGLRIDVVDTGIGIKQDVLPQLFAEFVQADASTTRRFGGTGLGLAICRQLATLMGGTIGVESEEGKGSRFWLELPFRHAEEVVGHGVDLQGLRCLVVDDNPLNREIFERQLRPWGVEVVSTASGDGALAELVKAVAIGKPFHAAIVDQHMPGMSGKELGAIVRAMPTLAGTRLVLATSGLADEAGAHFDQVFTKPVRPSALLRTLGEIHRPAEAAPVTRPAATEAPVVETRKLRVLVVEDNAINQRVAVGYLEKAGHRVSVASNGVEALSAVRTLPYDVVLMDVQMPEMDGLTATRAIRAFGDERASVPIIGLTANAMKEDREACLAAGMDDYLPKPVERAKLLEKLANIARSTPPRVSHAPHTSGAPAPSLRAVPAAPSTPPEVPFDLVVLKELRDALPADELDELVKGFSATVTKLEADLDAPDVTALKARVHGLVGSAGALGILDLSSAARDLEQAMAAGRDRREPTARLRALILRTVRGLSAFERAA